MWMLGIPKVRVKFLQLECLIAAPPIAYLSTRVCACTYHAKICSWKPIANALTQYFHQANVRTITYGSTVATVLPVDSCTCTTYSVSSAMRWKANCPARLGRTETSSRTWAKTRHPSLFRLRWPEPLPKMGR
ncbi:hypothetical protein N657DRAFT_501209 [Parathielavia appendiculata]|uniref:Uncharacterized protein n=1 Tax=Parathielavia appendiculata TaxID=2587402 RepID=A0AAN6TYB2_9PEZI|nr:hypothetical protein N657DRAFT_501209 [Parathielavia appendiculata]